MKKKIFILEDNPDIGYVLDFFLDDEGFEVTLFETVAAFEVVYLKELPDLFLLDVMLPDGNGLELCEELKQRRRSLDIPILMMSAHVLLESLDQDSCADGFISKPFDLEVVLQSVRTQLQVN